MSDVWQASVVLIKSSKSDEDAFGTGFVIYQEGQATYIVTCEHVVEKVGGIDCVRVADVDVVHATSVSREEPDFPAIRACSPKEGIDLAVLRVEERLNKRPLSLRHTPFKKNNSFRTAGFQRAKNSWEFASLIGVFGEQTQRGQTQFVTNVYLKIKGDDPLSPGNSGSPVVDESGYAVAVVIEELEAGKKGKAISIEAVKKVWLGRPPNLFWQPPWVHFVNGLNKQSVPFLNRLNRDWGSLAVLMLIVVFFMSDVEPTNSQRTFANNLAIIAYYLALVVFGSELCVLAVHVLAVRQHRRWLWSVGWVGLVVIGIVVYFPGIIFSLGGQPYEAFAIIVPLAFSWLVWVFALRKPIGSKSEDHLSM